MTEPTLYPASLHAGRWLAVLPVELRLEGSVHVVNAMIDSGSSQSAIPASFLPRLGVAWDDLELGPPSRGIGGPQEVRLLAGQLVHGGVTFASPVRVLASAPGGWAAAHLGHDFLERFDVAMRLHMPEPTFMVAPAGLQPLPDVLRVVVAPETLSEPPRPALSRQARRRLARRRTAVGTG